MHITKFWRASLILGLFIIVFAASRLAQADGVQEWLCRLVNYRNCEQLTKLIASRAADGEYATSVVIFDPATGSRKIVACGQCRDPLPIAASQIAVRTQSGLAVLSVDDRAVLQPEALARGTLERFERPQRHAFMSLVFEPQHAPALMVVARGPHEQIDRTAPGMRGCGEQRRHVKW